ncbi:hypothetical protein AK812_SmicGene11704 [Symbiodinium microadriaticum]|uniref:Uncharacterized protein n=1 Tax=Symbiodinium microadriaticum TaxID=2951 RepID=A0A1Q9ECJ3_SYMMI|nr:hypothetical protein AK812_SmicGene11704 [Symbiodinium microadriaticum]
MVLLWANLPIADSWLRAVFLSTRNLSFELVEGNLLQQPVDQVTVQQDPFHGQPCEAYLQHACKTILGRAEVECEIEPGTKCKAEEVELIQGDLLDADISQATHIFVSSLCFGEKLLALWLQAEVTRKLGREASALRCAATLTALPQSRAAGLRYRGSVFAEMTWTGVEGTRVWLYELQGKRDHP